MKQIAAHFGVSEETIRNWRKERGLPVEKLGGRIVANVDELDRWRKDSQASSAKQHRRIWVLGLAFGVLIAAVAAALFRGLDCSCQKWASYELYEGRLSLFDASGRELFQIDLGSDSWGSGTPSSGRVSQTSKVGLLVLFPDLDHDGHLEILLSHTPSANTPKGRLYCFNESRTACWQEAFIDITSGFEFQGEIFNALEGDYIAFVETRRRDFLIAGARHDRFPHLLLAINPETGKIVNRYSHPGRIHIKVHDTDADGDEEVLAFGANNPEEGIGHAILTVLDLPFAVGGKVPDSTFYAQSRSQGEQKYLLFPRTSLAEKSAAVQAAWVSQIQEDTGRILVKVAMAEPNASGDIPTLDYTFDFMWNLLTVIPDNEFKRIHARLYREGAIEHEWTDADRERASRVLLFPTAPHGNHSDIPAMFSDPKLRERVGAELRTIPPR